LIVGHWVVVVLDFWTGFSLVFRLPRPLSTTGQAVRADSPQTVATRRQYVARRDLNRLKSAQFVEIVGLVQLLGSRIIRAIVADGDRDGASPA
jgi:hypothetical protein